MSKKLNIAFFWHMHQPVYKDPATSEYVLPWVLFHSTKDYYDMVSILDEFPDIRQTFNLVPSLIEQINDYSSGDFRDRYREISSTTASELGHGARLFILERFFHANWEMMIRPVPRYWELLKKRGFSSNPDDIEASLRYFTDTDFLDLQTLFNLIWIDPELRARDRVLRRIEKKGASFTEADKMKVLSAQLDITRKVIPKYKEMSERGQVELTTSPYYHPIMPLLCDSYSARKAMPEVPLPKHRLRHPEDALAQLQMGIKLHTETFGEAPSGLWPSEGSVSKDILPLLRSESIKWFATDEGILSHSLGRPVLRTPEGHCKDTFLYRPYSIKASGGSLSVVFRDQVLSDLIGFEYASWDPGKATEDFITRLASVHDSVDDPENHCVNIILDGENAWETYLNDGRDFLVELYSALSRDLRFECVTISEFLGTVKTTERLANLHPGSWIDNNFKVWIGHPEDNTAWEYISEARGALTSFEASAPKNKDTEESVKEAWKALYVAQGSDWFWWYGDDHVTDTGSEFDSLFRGYLKKIYEHICEEPPPVFEVPIISAGRGLRPLISPTGFINPVFDGEVTNYFEWLSAGFLERVHTSGAMHREMDRRAGGPAGLVDGISYGFNLDTLFLRLDYIRSLHPYKSKWGFTINYLYPVQLRALFDVHGRDIKGALHEREKGSSSWREISTLGLAASGDVVEVGVPFKDLHVEPGGELRVFIEVNAGERGVERWPARGFLVIDIPTEDFELHNWMV